MYIVGYLDQRLSGKIFPLQTSDGTNLKQIIPGGQGQRVYATDGTSTCLTSQGGGWGAKTGLYFIDMNADPKVTHEARCITARQNAGVSNHKGEHSGVIGARAVITPERETVRQQGRRIKEPDEPMEMLPADHKAKWFAGAALNTAEQSMASVMSTALSRLNAFLDSELETILCNDTEIDAERFCNEKSAIFIIMPEEDSSKYFMVSLLIQQLYREMLAVADENGGKLKNRVVFYCDEFGTLPKIESAEMMFSASRSRRVSIVPIIQSFAQLEKNYGKEGAEIIIDNTQLTVFGGFAPNSESAQTLSKSLGSKTVLSGSISQSKNDPSRSLQMIERPLMTPDELKALPKGTFVVTKTGFYPMQVKLKLFFKWGIQFEKQPYIVPLRDVSAVEYASREELVKEIKAKYSPEEPQSEENTIPPGSVCVDEEMAMQNEANTQSPKLNTKPHKQEVKV